MNLVNLLICLLVIICCSCSANINQKQDSIADYEVYRSTEISLQNKPIEPNYYINEDYENNEKGAYRYFKDNATLIPNDLFYFKNLNNWLARYEQRPISALSYLAQIGYKDVENFLLKRFQLAFNDIIKNNYSLLEYQLLDNFNQLPPSKQKLDILISLVGNSQHCQSSNSDFRVYESILRNYYFKDVMDIHHNAYVDPKLKREISKYKENSDCKYERARIARDFPILRERISNNSIMPIDAKIWAEIKIWGTRGLVLEYIMSNKNNDSETIDEAVY